MKTEIRRIITDLEHLEEELRAGVRVQNWQADGVEMALRVIRQHACLTWQGKTWTTSFCKNCGGIFRAPEKPEYCTKCGAPAQRIFFIGRFPAPVTGEWLKPISEVRS